MTKTKSSEARSSTPLGGIRGFAPWSRVFRELAFAATTAVIALGLGVLALRITWADLGERWAAGGSDQILHYEIFASALDAFPFLANDRLGFPDAQNLFFAPLFDLWSATFVQIISPIVPDGVWAYNIYNLAGFAAIGFTAYFFFRALKTHRAIAMVLSVLFALAPFHFSQMMGHPFIGNYWAVPLIGILVLVVAGPATDPFAGWIDSANSKAMRLSRRILPIVVLTVALAYTQSYYFVFGAAVVGLTWFVSSVVALVSGRGWRSLLWPTVTIASLMFFIGIQLLWLAQSFGVRYEKYFSGRLPGESELYGGRIIDLILPARTSGFPLFGRWAERYANEALVLQTSEPAGTSLVAAIAIVLATALIVVRIVGGTHMATLPQNRLIAFITDKRVGTLLLAFIIAFLFFITTGLGAVLAWVVSPEIRAWSRMSIVLSLLALGVLALAIQMLAKKRVVLAIVLAVVAALGLVDQVVGEFRVARNQPVGDESIRAFAADAEELLPDDCGVVQLPLKGFPETGAVGDMGDYDQALPYIYAHDDSLRWSYGAVRGTYGADFWSEVDTQSEFTNAVEESGACAILVDQYAFTEDPDAWHGLVSGVVDPEQPDLVSDDEAERYLLFTVAD